MTALGRRLEHDPRSRNYRAVTAPVLRTVNHRHWGPVLDQGRLGSCTGNAAAQALNSTPLRNGRRLLSELDAVQLYHTATVLDGFPGEYPPEDTGSSGLGVAKAVVAAGYASGYSHAFGATEALAALVVSPIIVGTNWYEDMFNPNSSGYLSIGGQLAGGHEYAVIGLNVKAQSVTILNSWGISWGRAGRAYLTFNDFSALLAADGDATILNASG